MDNTTPTKADWESTHAFNERLVRESKQKLSMAEHMVKFCQDQIDKFPTVIPEDKAEKQTIGI